MSPENNIGIWAAIVGGVLSALGHSDWQRRKINRLEKKVEEATPLNCPIGKGLRKDVEALKRQAPSGEVPCAAADDVKEIKTHITNLFEGQTKMVGLVSKMAGKMGVKDDN